MLYDLGFFKAAFTIALLTELSEKGAAERPQLTERMGKMY
jgi:hypothetical protein